MKRPLTFEDLIKFLHRQNIAVSESQVDKLGAYHALLISWSHRQNLFAAGDKQYLIERHFVPSFIFVQLVQKITAQNIIDIGSGAGFPGIILQIMIPEISMTLIDSSRKKSLFLQEVNEVLNLGTCIKRIRVENLKIENSSMYDVAVARFLGDLNHLWFWVKQILKPSGVLLIQKGGEQEIAIPEKSGRIRTWHAEPSWIDVSPTLSSKYIIEVENKNE